MDPATEISAADAASGLAAMPEVNERAASAPAAAPAAPAAPVQAPAAAIPAEETDSLGRKFDPMKFRPEKDRIGRWKNLHAGRKGAGVSIRADTPPANVVSFVAPDPEPPKPNLVAEAAETLIGLIQTALIMLGQDDGILTESEKVMLRGPLERVMRKYGLGEMPCELELAAALAAIIIERLQRPKVQTRIERVKAWVSGWWLGRRGAAMAAKVAEVAKPAPAES